jgi:hypothetical protein
VQDRIFVAEHVEMRVVERPQDGGGIGEQVGLEAQIANGAVETALGAIGGKEYQHVAGQELLAQCMRASARTSSGPSK